jgi:hypothetical protein
MIPIPQYPSGFMAPRLADDFVVWAYSKTSVCTHEICEWYDSLSFEDLHISVAEFIEHEIRERYQDFSEWFNLAEYPDVLELFEPSEKMVFLRAAAAPDDADRCNLENYDCFSVLLAVIRHRLAQATIDQLKQAAQLFNWTVESGLFLCDADAGATVCVGNPIEVAPFLLDRIVHRLSETVPSWHESTEFEQKLMPFSPVLPMLKEALKSRADGDRVLALNLFFWIGKLYQSVVEND